MIDHDDNDMSLITLTVCKTFHYVQLWYLFTQVCHKIIVNVINELRYCDKQAGT